MKSCPWESIADFQSYSEFERFVAWIGEKVKSNEAEVLPVDEPYVGATTLKEAWYRHVGSGKRWRLVWPDAPFGGLFEPID